MRRLKQTISYLYTLGAGIAIVIVAILSFSVVRAWHATWTITPEYAPVFDYKAFSQAVGYKLGYDIYMPNSYTGWTPNKNNKLHFNNSDNTYELKGIDISGSQVDDWGARFKIASIDWQNEFGVTFAEATNEQSKFGIPSGGSVIRLKHYIDSRDIYFELPRSASAKYLNLKIKITSQEYHPSALLYVEYVQ